MKSQPLVSIIIPVYNGANYLREAVDSALAQTYPNVEILVVNDGSDDDGRTEEIALSYGKRIRYIKKENGGTASALNVGIRNMKGEYFSWLSHDDVYYPDKIEKEVEAVLQCGDSARIVQCEYDFHDEASGMDTPTDFYKCYSIEQLTNSVFSLLQMQIHACGALIHKSHFERVGIFDEKRRYTQDIEMWFRLLRGQRSLWVSERLYMVRVHSEADSKRLYEKWNRENAKLYYEMIQNMPDEELAAMYGTSETALCRVIGLIRSREGYEEAEALEKRLRNCLHKKHSDKDENVPDFREHLRGLCEGTDKEIVIFGAGQYGRRLLFDLMWRKTEVSCFMDNDVRKQGTQVDGIVCRSIRELKGRRKEILVIIAQRTCAEALRQMQEEGFPYVITRQELDGALLWYPPRQ